MTSRPRQILLSIGIALGFGAALFGAGRLGVVSALRTLPDSGQDAAAGPPIGVNLLLDTAGEPLYLADTVQGMRDFYFAFQTPEARREGDAEARGLRRVFEALEVHTLSRDADAIEVKVLAGPLAGIEAWIHVSQFPPPRSDS